MSPAGSAMSFSRLVTLSSQLPMTSTIDRTKIAGIVAALTQCQREALAILVKAGRPLRNRDFACFTGHRRTGFAKALGPCTKPREHDPASLWAKGLVRLKGLFYTITEAGQDVARAIGSTDLPRPAATASRVRSNSDDQSMDGESDKATAQDGIAQHRALAAGPAASGATLEPLSRLARGSAVLALLHARSRAGVGACATQTT